MVFVSNSLRAPLASLFRNGLSALLVLLSLSSAYSQGNTKYKDAVGDSTYIDPKFVPPSLDELNAKVKWNKGEVKNGSKHFEDYLSKQKREVTFKQALELKNDSTENNKKIVEAMRWQPDDSNKADYDATINRRMKGDVTSVNPLMVSSIEDFDLYNLIGVGLIGFDWDMQPFADSDIVKSWDRSEDSMYEKFVLRDDLVWSDGKPMTAYDLEFSFQVIMCPDVIIPAIRSGVDELKFVKAYDAHTLVVFHKNPLATNVWNMDFPFVPKHVYEKTWRADKTLSSSAEHRAILEQPVVAGPYKIVSREVGREIRLERREDYYTFKGKQVREMPYFKTVRLRIYTDPSTALLALKRADIEEMEFTSLSQWQNQTSDESFYAGNTKARAPEWTYYYLGWNSRDPSSPKDAPKPHPIFSDIKVRKAMQLAYPHDELIKVQNYGLVEPGMGIFHPSSWMFPKNAKIAPFKQDIDAAMDLLDEAGWEDTDGDGTIDKEINGKKVQFDFTIVCLNEPARIDACALLKNALDKMGIKCTVRPLELVTVIENLKSHKFDACFGGWGTGADPFTSENLWTTNAIDDGRNYLCYSNRQVDGLYELGKQIMENKKGREEIVKKYELSKVGIDASADRPTVYGKIHEILYNDAVTTVVFYKSSFYGFSKKLRGYSFSPRGPYHFSPGSSSVWKPTGLAESD